MAQRTFLSLHPHVCLFHFRFLVLVPTQQTCACCEKKWRQVATYSNHMCSLTLKGKFLTISLHSSIAEAESDSGGVGVGAVA